jgi:hypothetical protein
MWSVTIWATATTSNSSEPHHHAFSHPHPPSTTHTQPTQFNPTHTHAHIHKTGSYIMAGGELPQQRRRVVDFLRLLEATERSLKEQQKRASTTATTVGGLGDRRYELELNRISVVSMCVFVCVEEKKSVCAARRHHTHTLIHTHIHLPPNLYSSSAPSASN